MDELNMDCQNVEKFYTYTRIIKFRWWHIPSGNMTDFDTALKECDRLSFLLPSKDWVIMQSTGIYDMNDVEIFEGDILIPVKMHDTNIGCWKMTDNKAIPIEREIKWRSRGFDVPYDSKNWKVISNIYKRRNECRSK